MPQACLPSSTFFTSFTCTHRALCQVLLTTRAMLTLLHHYLSNNRQRTRRHATSLDRVQQ